MITEVVIIDDDNTIWTQKIGSPKHKTPTKVQDESNERSKEQEEVLHGIGFGPKVLDTIAERVADKIAHDGASAGAKPKYNIREEHKQEVFRGEEMYDKGTMRVRDVEHIAQLHDYIMCTPQMRKQKLGVWTSESDVKMEVDDDGTENERYNENNAKTKERILFHNQVYSLGVLMGRKLKNGKDLSLMEDTLFAIDRTFKRGVARDVESFFNSLVLMLGNYQNSMSCRYDVALHIAEHARSSYLVNVINIY